MLNVNAVMMNLNHMLSGDFTQDNFDIKTKTDIEKVTVSYSGITYLNNVKTDIKADLLADMSHSKYTFKDNEVILNELAMGIDGWFSMPNETDIDMDLKFNAKRTEFKNLLSLIPGAYTKDFNDIKTSGKLTLDGFAKGLYTEKKTPAFGAKILVENAMFKYPSLPKSATNILIDATVDNKTGIPDHTTIDIKKFHADLGGNPIDANMMVKTPVSDPDINGRVIAKLNLGSLKDVIPLEKNEMLNGNVDANVTLHGRMSSVEKGDYEKFNAAGQVLVTGMTYKTSDMPQVNISKMLMVFNPQNLEIASFDSKIGRSDIHATGKVTNYLQYVFKNQLLKGSFDMNSSLMDLNEFMSSAAEPEKSTADNPQSTAAVVEVPGNIDFTLNSKIGKLLYDNLTLTDVSGIVTVKDHKADLSNLKMNTLGGSMLVSGSYDTKNLNNPLVDFKVNITGFDIPSTFAAFNTIQKLAPVAKYCAGKFSTDLSFSTQLDKMMDPVLSTLSGKGKLLTNQVTVLNFEPLNKLSDALKVANFKKFNLNNLNLSFLFAKGKVLVDPFDFKAGSIGGKIAGSNGFDQTIDYVMTLAIPRSEFGAGANAAKIIFSKKAIVAPYKNINGLMFRIANQRNSELIEVEVQVILTMLDESKQKRIFRSLPLEMNKINFLTLSWTVVHPIDEESPLFNFTEKDLIENDVEFLLLVKGFEDAFSQTVYSRSSYKYKEIIWGGKFISMIKDQSDGIALELNKMDQVEKVNLN